MNPQSLPACCALHIVAELAVLVRAGQGRAELRLTLFTHFGLPEAEGACSPNQTLDLMAAFNLIWTLIGEHDSSDH